MSLGLFSSVNGVGDSLQSIDKILESTTDLVDIQVYDTRNDSDGGQWRYAASGNSLGTPPRVMAVYSQGAAKDTVTAIDVTQSATPVFKEWNVTNPSKLAVLDGKIIIATTVGYVTIDLILDEVRLRDTTGNQLADQTPATFDMTTVTWGAASGDGIVNNTVNDVAITALSGAETDPLTGLPYPTIQVMTGAGSSWINHDGTAANENSVIDGTGAINLVSGDVDENGFSILSSATDVYVFESVPSIDTALSSADHIFDTTATTGPTVTGALTSVFLTGASSFSAGSSVGVFNVDYVFGDGGSSVVSQTSTVFSAGGQSGDIRLAALANSKTADRSVKANTLTENGAVTEAAVETGAELMGYSGFSLSNYLSRPYDADFDFGTGDFMIKGWVKQPGIVGGAPVIFDRNQNPSSGANFRIELQGASGVFRFICRDDVGVTKFVLSSTIIDDDSWHMFVAINDQTNDQLLIYVDGVLEGTTSSAGLGDFDNGAAVTTVGTLATIGQSFDTGTISLLMLSAYAPSAAQIAKMYNDELPLFQENANCLISGTSDAVADLSYDTGSLKLDVATGDGNSVFGVASVLQRIDYLDSSNSPLTSDTMVAVSRVNDQLAMASNAEATMEISELGTVNIEWINANSPNSRVLTQPDGTPVDLKSINFTDSSFETITTTTTSADSNTPPTNATHAVVTSVSGSHYIRKETDPATSTGGVAVMSGANRLIDVSDGNLVKIVLTS